MKIRLMFAVGLLLAGVGLLSPPVLQAQFPRLQMFVTVAEHLYTRSSDDGGVNWSDFSLVHTFSKNGDPDYHIAGPPGVVSDASGRYVMVAKTADSTTLVYSYYTPTQRRPGWRILVKAIRIGSHTYHWTTDSYPAVSTRAPGLIEVFMHARRSDGAIALMHTWTDGWGSDGPIWSHWEVLGTGLMQGSPTAVSWGPGRTDVFVRGGGGELVRKVFDGRWGGWENFGGVLTSSPSVTSMGPGHLDVYGIGTNQGLWHRSFNGSWSGWEGLGGFIGFGTSPAVASRGGGSLDVFVYGMDAFLYQRNWSIFTGWSARLSTMFGADSASLYGSHTAVAYIRP